MTWHPERLATGAVSLDPAATASARRTRKLAEFTVGVAVWLALLAVGWAVLVVG